MTAATGPGPSGTARPVLPLTSAQRGVLTGHLITPRPAAYNTAEYVRIDGDLRPAWFDAALRRAVGEAEALGVRLVEGPVGPGQVPDDAPPWSPRFLDLRSDADPESAARAWMADEVAHAVDPFGDEPLFAHALLRTGEHTHLWYHRMHHVLLDGYGAALVMRRAAALYTSLAAGTEPEPSPFGSLRSVLDEEAAYAVSPQRESAREFWTARFSDRPPAIGLGRVAAHPSTRSLRIEAVLPITTAARIRQLARAARATWPEVVAAGAAIVLCRRASADETVLGFPMMNRIGTAALRVPSMVLNVLPLRVRAGAAESLTDVTANVARELRAVRPHQRYRYEDLARDLGLVGGERRLFAAVVNVMPYGEGPNFGEARSTAHNVSAGPVADLSVNVYDRGESGGGICVAFDANPACCTETDLADFAREFQEVLAGTAAAPRRPPTAQAAARPVDVLDRLRACVRERPDAVAVDTGQASLGYGALMAEVEWFAARLAGHGVGPGDAVALAMPRGSEVVVAQLAVLAVGAACLPLDPDGPPDRNRFVLDDVRPALVVTPEVYADEGRPVRGSAVRRVPPGAPAYIIHTSGSTGRPKGVVVSRAALAAYVAAAGERYGPGPDERVLQFAPAHFDAAVEEVFLTLGAGATLVPREPGAPESVAALLRMCAERRITWLGLPTAYWHEVAYALGGSAALPDCLRTVVIGGEAALAEHVRAWRRASGTGRVRLVNTYGPTEACVVALTAELAGPHAVYDGRGDVPIGTPLPGMRAAVLRGDGSEAAPGETGELYLAGDQLADGYFGRRAETAARFIAAGTLPGMPRAYRTGDLVRSDRGGLLCFVGRADDEFKVSGHRLHPAEAEAALVALPGVRQAAVFGHERAPGLRTVAAFVVADDPAPDLDVLRRGLLRALPPALVPGTFHFVDTIPLTPAGKTDRAALRALLPSPSPHPAGHEGGHDAAERLVAGIWADVLGIDTPAPDDDFFALGGQSLQTIRVANRLSVATGTEITVAEVFARPTLRELAAHISADGTTRATSPAPPDTAAVLPAHIRPTRSAPPPGTPARRILLTGATGFVGAHICAELLANAADVELVCLVRGDDPSTRLKTVLASWGLTADLSAHRVAVVRADAAAPGLGLSAADRRALTEGPTRVDAIVHAAAEVSLLRGTRSLRAVNIDATAGVLELAAQAGASVHHMSTLSVVPPGLPEIPDAFIAHGASGDGYAHSKWVAERLLEQAAARGIPVAVHRLGRVTGARATGIVNTRDILWRILFTGLPHGILPGLHDAEVWTPADELARDLVRLVTRAPEPGLVVNHAPQGTVALAQVHAWLRAYGYRFTVLPAATWAAQPALRSDEDASATAALFLQGPPPPRPDAAHTPRTEPPTTSGPIRTGTLRRALGGTSAVRPIDAELMHRYLDHCVREGRLPAPDAGNSGAATSDYH